MAKTYLQLVNEAILESKVTLDELTDANFASPPRTIMYKHFKRWVNRAYQDLLLSRDEWQFRIERATVTIWPRLQVAGLDYTPAVNDVLEGVSSGVRFTVKGVHTLSEDVESDATIERTLSIQFAADSKPENMILNERVKRISPTPDSDVGYVKGRGRYNFTELVPSVEQIHESTVTVQPSVASATSPSANSISTIPVLAYTAWESYSGSYDAFNAGFGNPTHLTLTHDGQWDFFPRPDEPFDVSFDYTQKVTLMSLPTDTPQQIPERFHDYIMWAAVMDYADFDERPKVFSRAKKHVDHYRYMLERDTMPKMTLNLSRFDY